MPSRKRLVSVCAVAASLASVVSCGSGTPSSPSTDATITITSSGVSPTEVRDERQTNVWISRPHERERSDLQGSHHRRVNRGGDRSGFEETGYVSTYAFHPHGDPHPTYCAPKNTDLLDGTRRALEGEGGSPFAWRTALR